MSGKTLLHRDIELCKWFVSVVHDPRFEQVLGHVKAELCDEEPTTEKLRGATHALAILQTITDNQSGFDSVPGPGLDHRTPEQILESTKEKK